MSLEIFAVCAPGLEPQLLEEAVELGFDARPEAGGVTIAGGWPEVWRANLWLRGATRVLVRLASFMAFHPAQLDKRATKLPWTDWLRPDIPVRVDATCRKSKIYHAGAATDRIEGALRSAGIAVGEGGVRLLARIESNRVTLSVDTSGEPLHRRGLKEAVAKAPMRETLAALFLRAAGWNGTAPVLDPMCGSGTFVIEAADRALGQAPGRARGFTFQDLATFDPAAWEALPRRMEPAPAGPFLGFDRDPGAVRMATDNAARAGIDATFAERSVADLVRPDTPPGLVIVNPPYGTRIGNKGLLIGIHRDLGARLREHFAGWRVAIVTSEAPLAKATGLPFGPPGPIVPHGGLKVRLWMADL